MKFPRLVKLLLSRKNKTRQNKTVSRLLHLENQTQDDFCFLISRSFTLEYLRRQVLKLGTFGLGFFRKIFEERFFF